VAADSYARVDERLVMDAVLAEAAQQISALAAPSAARFAVQSSEAEV
jgi:hypothetical protein